MMLFKRKPKWPMPEMTERQKNMLAQKPARIAKKLAAKAPLFADQFEPEPIDVDAEILKRIALADDFDRVQRQAEARNWIKARAQFFACDQTTQLKIAIHWACWSFGPRDAGCFAYVVRKYSQPYVTADQRKPRVIERQKWIDALKNAYRYSSAA